MVKESQLYFVFSLTSMFRTNPRQRLIAKKVSSAVDEIRDFSILESSFNCTQKKLSVLLQSTVKSEHQKKSAAKYCTYISLAT